MTSPGGEATGCQSTPTRDGAGHQTPTSPPRSAPRSGHARPPKQRSDRGSPCRGRGLRSYVKSSCRHRQKFRGNPLLWRVGSRAQRVDENDWDRRGFGLCDRGSRRHGLQRCSWFKNSGCCRHFLGRLRLAFGLLFEPGHLRSRDRCRPSTSGLRGVRSDAFDGLVDGPQRAPELGALPQRISNFRRPPGVGCRPYGVGHLSPWPHRKPQLSRAAL